MAKSSLEETLSISFENYWDSECKERVTFYITNMEMLSSVKQELKTSWMNGAYIQRRFNESSR